MKPLLTVAAVLAATAGYGLSRRHRHVTAAAPELRNAQLYVPLSVRSDASLRVGRKLMAARPAEPAADGIEMRTDGLPATAVRPAVPVVVYEPGDRSVPSGALLWMHGGGLVMGSPESGHALCGRLAAAASSLLVVASTR